MHFRVNSGKVLGVERDKRGDRVVDMLIFMEIRVQGRAPTSE